MIPRRSIPAIVVLAAVALVGLSSEDPGLLLGLLPAIAVLTPLVLGLFPGERAIEVAGRWLGNIRRGRSSSVPPVALDFVPASASSRLTGLGFGTRGPPALAPTI